MTLDDPVRTVRVVIHTTGRMGHSDQSHNHTTVYLLLEHNRSWQLNMTHGPDNVNGTLRFEQKNYQHSRTETMHTDYRAVALFSPRDVGNALQARDLHLFDFSDGGMGCKHWV